MDHHRCEQILKEFLKVYGRLLEKYLAVILGGHCHDEDREDLLQEVLMGLFCWCERLEDCREIEPGEVLRVARWIARNQRNRILRRYYRERRLFVQIEEPIEPPGSRSLDSARTAWKKELLNEALANLNPIYRDPFLLYEVMGCTYEEIATDLGITEANARLRVFRARAKLQAFLEGKATKEELLADDDSSTQ